MPARRCIVLAGCLLALALAPPPFARPAGPMIRQVDSVGMTVSDMDRAVRFFADVLAFERIVFGARLRITALRAQNGPGIELLEYLAPRDGRPIPPDERANDVSHWQTRLVAPNDGSARALGKAGATFVSPGAVMLPRGELGFTQGLVVRDPDGHALQIVEAR